MAQNSQTDKKPVAAASEQTTSTGADQQQTIADWLQQVKFKRSFIGGVREEDVWKKISELNALYEKALAAERIRCDVLIEHYRQKIGTAEGETKAGEEHSGITLMEKRQ